MSTTTLATLERFATVKGIGLRKRGGIWFQSNSHLAFMSPNGSVRRLRIDSIMRRGREWAGNHVYVEDPEALWVGLDGRGRMMTRVDLGKAERSAKPWPRYDPRREN